jgi:hypothetical protein
MHTHAIVLKEEIKNRARIYALIYRELSKEIGSKRAAEVLKRAIYARGREKGEMLRERIGAPDLTKLADDFVKGAGEMDTFGHEIAEKGPDSVVLRLNQCPLAEAWDDMQFSPEEKRILCDIAYQIDFGKFEAAGYELSFNCRIADGGQSCDLCVKDSK